MGSLPDVPSDAEYRPVLARLREFRRLGERLSARVAEDLSEAAAAQAARDLRAILDGEPEYRRFGVIRLGKYRATARGRARLLEAQREAMRKLRARRKAEQAVTLKEAR